MIVAKKFLSGIDLSAQQIKHVADGSSSDDAATYGQVLTLVSQRVTTLTATSNTYTPDADTTDVALIVAPVANFTIAAPSGTPADEQRLRIKVKSDSTGRTPTWNAVYSSSGVAILPSGALPASKTVTFGFIYDATATKWVLLASDPAGY